MWTLGIKFFLQVFRRYLDLPYFCHNYGIERTDLEEVFKKRIITRKMKLKNMHKQLSHATCCSTTVLYSECNIIACSNIRIKILIRKKEK